MTSRTKIAQRVAYDVRKAAFKRLRREAGDRLTDDEMEELADWIETRVEEDVNGRLKVKAAEKHGHDLVPDGGGPEPFCAAISASDGEPAAVAALLRSLARTVEEMDEGRFDVDVGVLERVDSEGTLVPDGGWPTGDPCPECGEPMDVGAVAPIGEAITWQECDDCGIGWGPFTGYVDTDEETGDAELVTDGGEQTVVCYGCGAYVQRRQTEDIDVSPPDEYYPDMRALCPDCSGDSEDDAELVTDGGREYEPIYEIRDGTCRYYEGEPGEEYEVTHEGGIEIYPNWVRLTGGPARKWVPRERVEGVSEL